MNEKEQHLDIREKLRNLPPVKASDDFVMQLQRRINLAEAQPSTQIHKEHKEKLEEGFFARLFGGSRNTWLVPAMGVTAVIFLVFIWTYVMNQNNVTTTGDNQQPSITQSETEKNTETAENNENKISTPLGETLKTEIPGKEITESFGYTDSKTDMTRGDKEGGTLKNTDEFTGTRSVEAREIEQSKPTVKMTEEEKDASPPAGIIKPIDKTTGDDKVKSATMPMKKKESDKKDSKIKTESEDSLSSERRISRNIIEKTDLENLQEKVEESEK